MRLPANPRVGHTLAAGRDGGLPTSIGTHGFQIWGDDGLGAYDWFPCWVRTSDEFHANEMEGQCAPPLP